MSLASDMSMYYRNTYVGYRTAAGRVLPFFVQEVNGRSSDSDYSQENMDSLIFTGIVYYDDRETNRNVVLGEGRLVLELPELGYIISNGRPRWLTYRPVQQASKGLSGRRLVGSAMNNGVAKLIYKALWEQPDNLARQFCFHNGNVLYKGMNIGTREGDNCIIKHLNRFHAPYLIKAYPDLNVSVGEEE